MACLSDEEYRHFMKLQELLPLEDPAYLYHISKPFLKSAKTFNAFLYDLMEKKYKNGAENEIENEIEKGLKESLEFAFTRQVNISDPPQPIETVKKNTKSISSKSQEESEKSVQKSYSASLWDNMDSIQNDQRLLEEILYGETLVPDRTEVVKGEKPEAESDEKREAIKALDSDTEDEESYHSVDEEPDLKHTHKTNVFNPEKNENFSFWEKTAISNSSKNRRSFGDPGETVGEADNRGVKETFAKNIGEGNSVWEIQNDMKEPTFKKHENISLREEAEDPKKNFSIFNNLIMKKKEDPSSLKPEENLEKKNTVSSDAVRSIEAKDQSTMIDYFFYSSQKPKEKETVENNHSDYESKGAIPKTKNFSKTDNDNDNANANAVSTTERSAKSVDVYPMGKTTSTMGRNLLGGEVSEDRRNESGKKFEEQTSSFRTLEIPNRPFVYVVSESYSPAFRLPKGNYYISHIFPTIESVGMGMDVVNHPTNIIEKKVEISNKRFEPQREPTKKSDVFTTKKENLTFPKYILSNESQISKKSYAETTRSFDVSKFKGQLSLEPSKTETEKIPSSKIKGKIFCNTPLQSLKKEDEDRNDSADAYGAILQSVADDFKSSKKSNQQKKTPSSEEKPSNSDRNVLLEALRPNSFESSTKKTNRNVFDDVENDFSRDRFGFEKFQSLTVEDKTEEGEEEDEGSDEGNIADADDDDDDDDHDDDSSDELPSNEIMTALKYSDPNYLKRELKNCGNDIDLQKEVIRREIERSLRIEVETQLINEGYVKILKELPQLDPKYLLDKWTDIAGDDSAIEALIQEEKLKIQVEDIKNELISKLPRLDKEYLESKAKNLLFDREELDSFIAEEKKKLIIDEEYQRMVDQLRGEDPVLPKEKIEEFKGDAASTVKELRDYKVEEARSRKALLTCECCFENELLESDVSTCPNGHLFCFNCFNRSTETKLSDADTSFTCPAENCGTEFTLAILERVLPKKFYEKVLKKKQSAELKQANVPGLESCPSCDYAYIPAEEDRNFKCQNSDCGKEICRKCKENNHLPLKCEEVERPKDLKVRTEIEEKMTEALVRTCLKCGKKFVKTDGCNKMTCTCGAVMCYVCRKPVTDYSHFNGQGGDKTHLCPLYSNNDDLHVGAVRRVGQIERDRAFRENPDLHLVHDPTKTI